MQTRLKVTLFGLACGLSVPFFITQTYAQTNQEFEQIAAQMRAAGQSEQQIKQTLESMRVAQKFQQEVEANQASGMSEEQAAMQAAGLSPENIAAITTMQEQSAGLNELAAKAKLDRAINAFRAEHGAKPSITVTVEDQEHLLKLIRCDQKIDTFNIYAEAEPTSQGHGSAKFQASRSGPFAGGDGGKSYYLESLMFTNDDGHSYHLAQGTGSFEGNLFKFTGEVTQSKEVTPAQLSVSLECAQ